MFYLFLSSSPLISLLGIEAPPAVPQGPRASPEAEQCINRNVCTIVASGRQYIPQYYFHCMIHTLFNALLLSNIVQVTLVVSTPTKAVARLAFETAIVGITSHRQSSRLDFIVIAELELAFLARVFLLASTCNKKINYKFNRKKNIHFPFSQQLVLFHWRETLYFGSKIFFREITPFHM